MVNSWSLLFDELNMTSDTINIGTHLPGGMGNDHIVLSSNYGDYGAAQEVPFTLGVEDSISFDLNIPDLPITDNHNGRWKYNEDVILKEVREYLGMTYRSHYTSEESKTQTLDLIEGIGDDVADVSAVANSFTHKVPIKIEDASGNQESYFLLVSDT